MAAARFPKPANCASGPLWPIRQVDSMIRPGLTSRSVVVVEPPGPHGPGAERLDDHVGPAAPGPRSTGRASGRSRSSVSPSLPAFTVVEQAASVSGPASSSTNGARPRAASRRCRRLDPHDGGAVVGEHPGGDRAGHRPTEVEHLEARQRRGSRGGRRPVTVSGRAAAAASAGACRLGQDLGGVLADGRRGPSGRSGVAESAGPRPCRGGPPARRAPDRRPPASSRARRAAGWRRRRRRRDRRDQHPALERRREQLGLGLGGREGDDARPAPARTPRAAPSPRAERHGVADPVLVPRGLVAEALLVHPLHEAAGEGTDGRAEQEGDRDVAVRARPTPCGCRGRRSSTPPPARAASGGVGPATASVWVALRIVATCLRRRCRRAGPGRSAAAPRGRCTAPAAASAAAWCQPGAR